MPDKTAIESTPPAVASTSPAAAAPVNDELSPQRAEQNRRRSAIIRYQAADGMIRAGDYGRAISMLEMGDNSGDDPRSLANRYLLPIALEARIATTKRWIRWINFETRWKLNSER